MIELNKIHLMDCMEGMAHFPDNYFDLAIVDPPYGIGDFQQSDGNFEVVKWNYYIPDEKYFNELCRVSEKQIIWGANYYNCFSKKGGSIIWDKKNMHPSMSRCEIASKSWEKKVDYFQYEWHGYIVSRENHQKIHPCTKPIQLYKWLLRNYAEPNFKILDTHVGSASSVIAFEHFGCEWIGFEIDADYHAAATERIKNELAQMRLF